MQSSLRVAKEQGSKLMSTTGSYVYSAASKVRASRAACRHHMVCPGCQML